MRLLELTAAYGALANGGYRVDPAYILEVRDRRRRGACPGGQPPDRGEPVLDPRVAYLITDILSDNDARIPSFGPASALQHRAPGGGQDRHDDRLSR